MHKFICLPATVPFMHFASFLHTLLPLHSTSLAHAVLIPIAITATWRARHDHLMSILFIVWLVTLHFAFYSVVVRHAAADGTSSGSVKAQQSLI